MVVSHFTPAVTGGEIYNYRLYEFLNGRFSEVTVVRLEDTPYRFRGGFLLRNLWFLRFLKGRKKGIANGQWDIGKGEKGNIVIIEDVVRSPDLFLFNAIVKVFKGLHLYRGVRVIPLVHHLYTPLFHSKVMKALTHIYERVFLGNSDGVIANSEFTAREVENLTGQKMKMVIAYPGPSISTSAGHKTGEADRDYPGGHDGIKHDGTGLLFVGSVSSRKGVDTLIEAFKILVNDRNLNGLTLHIVGDTDKERDFSEGLREYCRKEGLEERVIFEGRVSDQRLETLYSSSDIFVFPSRWEGFGMVLIEAMSHRLPVVAADAGAIPYLIKHGKNGFLVPTDDPIELASAIEKLVEAPPLREKFGEYGSKFASGFNWNTSFSKIVAFIEEVCENKTGH